MRSREILGSENQPEGDGEKGRFGPLAIRYYFPMMPFVLAPEATTAERVTGVTRDFHLMSASRTKAGFATKYFGSWPRAMETAMKEELRCD